MMSADQLAGLVRTIAALGAGYAAKLGLDGDTYMWIVSGIMGLGTAAWSWYSNRPGKKIQQLSKIP